MNHATKPQPASKTSMDLYNAYHHPIDEKHSQQHQHDSGCQHQHGLESNSPSHRGCHSTRLRQLVVPASLIALAFIAFMAWVSYDSMSMGDTLGGLVKRQYAQQEESGFVRNKLYLIVIFVGLFLVLVAGIMLSAWCCKGAFVTVFLLSEF